MSENNGPYKIIETCTDVWVNGPGIDTSSETLTIEMLNTAFQEGRSSLLPLVKELVEALEASVNYKGALKSDRALIAKAEKEIL